MGQQYLRHLSPALSCHQLSGQMSLSLPQLPHFLSSQLLGPGALTCEVTLQSQYQHQNPKQTSLCPPSISGPSISARLPRGWAWNTTFCVIHGLVGGKLHQLQLDVPGRF